MLEDKACQSKILTGFQTHHSTKSYKSRLHIRAEGSRVPDGLLWNVWKRVDDARALMVEQGPFKAEDLKGKIKGE